MDIGSDDVFIVVESAAEAADSFRLRNPGLALIPCSEPILVERFLVWRSDDDNPVLAAFIKQIALLDEELTSGQPGNVGI